MDGMNQGGHNHGSQSDDVIMRDGEMIRGSMEGTDGNDVLTVNQPTLDPDPGEIWGSTGIRAREGDDILNVRAENKIHQTHTYAGAGDDTINMTFGNMVDFSFGHHVMGGDLFIASRGSDTYNFDGLGSIDATVVGRIDDFNPSEDRIRVEGETLDLSNLPGNMRIVEYNGSHDDPGADPQQWLLIDTGEGNLFYSLGGARIDMNGNGRANDGQQETHFLADEEVPDFDALQTVSFVDPVDYLPAGVEAQDGGLRITDGDRDGADVRELIEGSEMGDAIAAGLNDDTVAAGGGNDEVWGGSGHDSVAGGGGDDALRGGTSDDEVDGESGNDRVWGNQGDDTLRGADGDDSLWGGSGNDVMRGWTGEDLVAGGSGDDRLWGGAGDDVMRGGSGSDQLWGEAGDDVFEVSAGDGQTTIRDFGTGDDSISLDGLGIDSFTALRDRMSGDGDATTIDLGGGETLVLSGVSAGDLNAGDFMMSETDAAPEPAPESDVTAPEPELVTEDPGGLPDPALVATASVGEAGSVTVEQETADQWHSVSFGQEIEDAVVVMGPLSYSGPDGATTRVRNVTDEGFEFQIDEWSNLDGWHMAETVGWMAVSEGVHELADGRTIAASTASVGTDLSDQTFGTDLSDAVVLTELVGDADDAPVAIRTRDVGDGGFSVQVQEEEGADGVRAAEDVAWIAMEGGTGDGLSAFRTGNEVDHQGASFDLDTTFDAAPVLLADMQTRDGADTAVLRYDDLDGQGVDVFVQDETSLDDEVWHSPETVGIVAVEEGFLI